MPQNIFFTMKKFFHAALVLPLVLFAVSCSESDEGPKSVELTGGTESQQTVYADDKQAPAPIRFTAKAAWTATVAEVQTKAEGGSSVDWLKLDAYSGGAGDVSLTMTLEENTTGHDRKAEIRIECAGTTLTITVEQKGTKRGDSDVEDPNNPENPDQPTTDLKNRIVRIDQNWSGTTDAYYEFKYDEAGRVVGGKRFQYGDGNYGNTEENMTVTYGDKTITYKSEGKEGNYYNWTEADSDVLDENGRVVSEKFTAVEQYEGKTDPYESSSRFTYDANGYLIKTETIYPNEDKDLYQITWTNGNPTQVIWTSAENPTNTNPTTTTTTDRATYGTIENKANLDLNWLIALNGMEGWQFSVGESLFPAATGYMGKRSKYMAETVTGTGEYDKGSYTNEYQFDNEGRIVKIISKDNNGDTDIYTIRYAE